MAVSASIRLSRQAKGANDFLVNPSPQLGVLRVEFGATSKTSLVEAKKSCVAGGAW